MKKKNLVLLIPSLKVGGAERVVSRLSFLLREEFNVRIVLFDNREISYGVASDVFSLNLPSQQKNNLIVKFINVIKRVWLYKKYKKNNSVDITYSFGGSANLVNVLSLKKDKKIVSIRGFRGLVLSPETIKLKINKILNMIIFSMSDRILTVSKLISQKAVEAYHLNESKVFTSYNGYDSDRIMLESKVPLEKNMKDFFMNNYVVITAGTFKIEKGYWHLLKGFYLAKKKCPKLKLAILGADYKNNRNKVEVLSSKLGIKEDILFLGYEKNPYKYFSKARAYVLSSVNEGFPNAMVEAMCCGLPIIAADCSSGPREILAPNTSLGITTKSIEISKYGILVEEMSEKENYFHNDFEKCDINLGRAINFLINDEKLMKSFSKKSILRSKDFSFKEWKNKQKELIEFKNNRGE